MFNFIKSLFANKYAHEIANRELKEAECDLLEARSAYDYAKRMVDYNTDRVNRLTHYLAQGQRNEN